MKIKSLWIAMMLLVSLSACGSVQNKSLGSSDDQSTDQTDDQSSDNTQNSDTNADANDVTPEEDIVYEDLPAYFFGTNFGSAGQVYRTYLGLDRALTNLGVVNLGSSAVIRYFDGLIYILHDGFSIASLDNVQIIDPSKDFATITQFSTGNGTNPQDIVVVGNKAYITLYDGQNDASNKDENGDPGHLIIMNLKTGDIEKRISFQDFLNPDGDENARAARMFKSGDRLYVAIQDLQSDFSHNAPGKIAIIDLTTDTIEDVITLTGRNPVDLVVSATENKLYVAEQAPYDFAIGNFNTTLPNYGVEVVDLNDPSSTTLMDDEDLGGYIERLSINQEKVFAVVSQLDGATFQFTSQIMQMLVGNLDIAGWSILVGNGSDVRDFAVDGLGQLWLAGRRIIAGTGTTTDAKIFVFDTDTGEELKEFDMPDGIPATSIALGYEVN